MARIIAFAETTPALLAGAKTVTRREWNDRYGQSFKAGEVLQAWDRSPRTGKGKRVAMIRLTEAPTKVRANSVMPSDWRGEGFEYMEQHGLTLFGGKPPGEVYNAWASAPDEHELWVVRFEVIEAASSTPMESK